MKKLLFTQRCKLAFLAGLLVVLATDACAQRSVGLRDSLLKATNEMEYHPDSVDLRLKRAGINLLLEEWQKAKDDYDLILRLEPENVAALYFRAYANERLHRYGFARLDYESVLRLVPGNFEARLGLALLNQKARHFTEALDQLNQLVEQNPDSAVAYAARAGVEVEREMLDLAEYDYGQALRLSPDNRDFLLAHADVCLKLKHLEKARTDLDRLVELGTSRAALTDYYKRLRKK